ncbi:hypothetical protein ACGGZK_08280 [Agromyces sp. MMS24-K17]|uniref:hypothetical protein n=1 Tax=Agromyces sp. MMS24-K17 TaxID=3372850 RepID=UPI0037551534
MSVAVPPPHPARRLRGARRVAVIAIIASLTVTAVLGILVLLGGAFGDVQWRILSTTLLIAGFSITALCHLAVAGRPVRIVGFAGLAVSGIALAIGLVIVWGIPETWDGWDLWRWFGVAGILAISLAHANLLLLLAARLRWAVRIPLAMTLAAIAVVAIMLVLPLATDGQVPGPDDGETYWRWFGVIAILDALGTIVVPVLALFLRDPVGAAAGGGEPLAAPPVEASAPAGASAPAEASAPTAPASPALEARIAALAAATGLDRDQLLAAALDAFEADRVERG